MNLYNVIISWDVYAVAESEDAATAATIELAQSGEIPPSYRNAMQVKTAPVRPQWRDERPIVGADVSDADFARVKGKTTQQVYDMLLRKQPAND